MSESESVEIRTAGDLWKCLHEGKSPIPSIHVPAIQLERALALCCVEGGKPSEAMEKLIAKVALAKYVDRCTVVNMPLVEFVGTVMKGQMLPIESGIPVPLVKNGGRKKYPFKDLAVGESFFVVETDRFRRRQRIKQLATTAGSLKKKIGLTFTTRSEEDGIRVWRTA